MPTDEDISSSGSGTHVERIVLNVDAAASASDFSALDQTIQRLETVNGLIATAKAQFSAMLAQAGRVTQAAAAAAGSTSGVTPLAARSSGQAGRTVLYERYANDDPIPFRRKSGLGVGVTRTEAIDPQTGAVEHSVTEYNYDKRRRDQEARAKKDRDAAFRLMEKRKADEERFVKERTKAETSAYEEERERQTRELSRRTFAEKYGYYPEDKARVAKESEAFKKRNVASRTAHADYERSSEAQRLTDTYGKGGFGSVVKANQAFKDYIDSARKAHSASEAFNDSQRYIGRNMVENVKKVASWTASVSLLYGSLNMVRSGANSLVELEYQQARLTQVFQGGREQVKGMVDDVLHLAAVNGRTSSEAMESAIAWSRLGYNRVQVTEAVRVSLMAANVAEISSTQATEHLASMTAVYSLQVSQLNGVLGMLNATSNTYNVTNKDLLDGITRTAAAAKQAGIPLAELIGIVGAGVGATGQTGANIGNAVKSFIGSITAPDKQQFLRDQFKFEVTTDGGERLKDMRRILAELFVAFQNMTAAERQSMIFSTAGKNQASRITAILDNYIKSQTLAINAQLNLNSAEQENERIKSTMRAQLQGLVTEWEKFVKVQGEGKLGVGPLNALKTGVTALRNVLALANTSPGQWLTAAFLGLIGALGAKLVITAVQMDKVGKSGGIVRNTLAALGQSMNGMKEVMERALGRTGAFTQSLAGMNAEGKIAAGSFKTLKAGAVLAGAAFMEFGVWVVAAIGAMWLFNKAVEAMGFNSDTADSALANLAREGDQAARSAEAAGTKLRLFKTIQDSLAGNKSETSRDALLRGFVDAQFASRSSDTDADRERIDKRKAARLAELQVINRMADAEKRNAALAPHFDQAATDVITQRAEDRQKAFERNRQEVETIEADIKRLKGSWFGRGERLRKKEDELAAAKDKGIKHAVDEGEFYGNELDQFMQTSARAAAFIESQKSSLEAIQAIYQQLPGDTYLDKLNKETLQHQVSLGYLKQQLTLNNELRRQAGLHESMTAGELAPVVKRRRDELTDFNRETESLRAAAIQKLSSQVSRSGGVAPGAGIPVVNIDPESPIGKTLAEREAGSKRQREEIDRLQEQLSNATASDQHKEIDARTKVLNDQIKDRQAGLSAANSPAQRYAATLMDRRSIAMRLNAANIDALAVGENAGEQLVNQVRGTRTAIARAESRSGAISLPVGPRTLDETKQLDNLRIEALGNRVALQEQLIHGEEMIKQLHKEELNLLIQKNREYQRSIMMAGPAELLRKLAVNQLTTGRNIGAGGFFALDRGAREDFLSQPGNSEDVRSNRRSQASLRGAGFGHRTSIEIQDEFVGGVAARDKLRQELAQQVPISLNENAIAAAVGLDRFTSALAKAEGVLNAIGTIRVPEFVTDGQVGAGLKLTAQSNHP